ncbi:MAG: histone deacetylase [Planctomycetota bacterium]
MSIQPDAAPFGLYFDPRHTEHACDHQHPERPARADAVRDALMQAEDSAADAKWLPCPPADRTDLERAHAPELIDRVERAARAGTTSLDPDTYLSAGSFDAARRASGAAVDAVRRVRAGELAGAFVVARPPGHHAERRAAMGFCLFDHVAVAAHWLRAEGGLDRVAIVDFDVHHGNGTQDVFWDDAWVFYASLHEWPLFPGTGAANERGSGAGEGTTLNLPQAAGSDGRQWLGAVEGQLLPALEAFEPQFLLISAGFDAHVEDPLARSRLTTADYGRMTELLTSGLPVPTVSLLEGGYDLAALAASARAHVDQLARSARTARRDD